MGCLGPGQVAQTPQLLLPEDQQEVLVRQGVPLRDLLPEPPQVRVIEPTREDRVDRLVELHLVYTRSVPLVALAEELVRLVYVLEIVVYGLLHLLPHLFLPLVRSKVVLEVI